MGQVNLEPPRDVPEGSELRWLKRVFWGKVGFRESEQRTKLMVLEVFSEERDRCP